MSIDPTPELRVNIRVALLALSVIMAATMVGTAYNTWHHHSAAYERAKIIDSIDTLKATESDHFAKVNRRIDYLRRVTNKRLDNLEAKRAGQ